MEKFRLLINEEYGYRTWMAELDKVEVDTLRARWRSMIGLHCSVPVNLIIPQAVEVDETTLGQGWGHKIGCHIHEHDDSWLVGVDYSIPAPEYPNLVFTIEGVSYTLQDLRAWSADHGHA